MQNVHLYGECTVSSSALAHWVGGFGWRKWWSITIPVAWGARKYGLSWITRVILDLFTVTFLLRYSKSPIQIFGRIGLFSARPAFCCWRAWCWVTSRLSRHAFAATSCWNGLPWVDDVFHAGVLRLHFISMGSLAEIQIRTCHELQQADGVIRETSIRTRAGVCRIRPIPGASSRRGHCRRGN